MFIIFFLFFVSIYGGINLYLFVKARNAFGLVGINSICLAIFLVLMIIAPILVRFFERNELSALARVIAYIGYAWMAFVFMFFCASILLDFFRLVLRISSVVFKFNVPDLLFQNTYYFLIACILSIGIVVYGYFEAKDIRQENIIIKTSKISKAIGPVKIVQISDIHLGLTVGNERLKNIISIIKEINPDILVSTGDLVDATLDNIQRFAGLLNEVNPKYGKYAVTGNHEFYAGIDSSIDFTQKAGFKMLRGESLNIKGVVNIAGVDDTTAKIFDLQKQIEENNLLNGLPQGQFNILLKHRPEVTEESINLFNLQLSGHTHKGQIYPFYYLIRLFYKYPNGLWNLKEEFNLYVSRGTGTWGPLVRFLAPPEITLIELIPE